MAIQGIIYESKEDDIQITGSKMSFSVNKKIPLADSDTLIQESSPKKKSNSKRSLSDGLIVHANNDLPQTMSNQPYHDSYNETNNMLKSVIYQSDAMSNDINKDLNDIRRSKTLKKKYDYISLLSSTSSALLGTKVTAIRELNKSITDSHNLELKRTKELKLTQAEEDDDKRISDLYNAFISTPIGVGGAANFIPQSSELNYVPSGAIEIGATGANGDIGYEKYLNNMTPEQNMMRFENDPNVKTVVKYQSDTGARWFDVIDLRTGESIDNTSKPSPMLLENLTLDVRNSIARDTNLDITYPLVVIGNKNIQEY